MLHQNQIIFTFAISNDTSMDSFIDTHTHLYDEAFDEDRDAVIERSEASGVTKFILPDIDGTTRGLMFGLADKYPGKAYPCLGLHPTSVDSEWEAGMEKMHSYSSRKIAAIGETGMDCYWSKEFISEQKEVLRQHFILADRLGLPVIIHSRDATEHIFDVLEACRHLNLRGVFHAYSGSIETFRRIQGYGDWYVGIGGVLTYKNASIAETVRNIPLDRIVLETDSPYLTPVPKRGTRNESSYIPFIAGKLAGLKGVSVEEIAETTSDNAAKLFSI